MNSGNTVILTFGDKLKTIRIKYNLRQDELSGNDITRNLISEIETDKANITKKTAEIIIKNLNEIAKKKHFEITETIEYLLESELQQANKILDKYINELRALIVCKDNSFTNELKEVERFLINWDIRDKKITIYELAGDYFYNKNDFYKSVLYYERALELTNKVALNEGLLTLLRKLSVVYTYIYKYVESINCCEFALEHFKDMTQSSSVIFLYNKALAYKKLGNLEGALENLSKAEKILDKSDTKKLFLVLNNKANCLYRLEKYEDSLAIFNRILRLYESDTEKNILIRVNIINNYMELNNIDKVQQQLNEIIKQMASYLASSEYSSEIYFEIGKIYNYLNNEKLEEEFLKKSIEISYERSNYDLFFSAVRYLIELYTKSNDVNQMSMLKDKVFEMASRNQKINEKSMFLIIGFFCKNKDISSINEILNFSLKLVK